MWLNPTHRLEAEAEFVFLLLLLSVSILQLLSSWGSKTEFTSLRHSSSEPHTVYVLPIVSTFLSAPVRYPNSQGNISSSAGIWLWFKPFCDDSTWITRKSFSELFKHLNKSEEKSEPITLSKVWPKRDYEGVKHFFAAVKWNLWSH